MFVGQVSRSGFTGWFWSRAEEIAVECQPGLQSSKGPMGLEDLLPAWLTHRDGRSVLPWWEFLVPCHMHSPWTAGVFS